MKRTVIKIDEELCNGCGLCIDGCHEGALQLVDGKARMISDLYCDGLGACIGECPVGAITFEEREAEPYDEVMVMERISPKGEATVLAHLNHLIDHNQDEYVQQGIDYVRKHSLEIDLSKLKNFKSSQKMEQPLHPPMHQHLGGCPGARAISFDTQPTTGTVAAPATDQPSELRQWPIQLHLVSPFAPYFQNADIVLAADCVAFSMGNFHNKFLKGKSLAIACPKLDSNKEVYVEKLAAMIDQSKINTLSVMIMEVPCCQGLLQLARMATQKATRKVPVKGTVVSLRGEVISEEWM